MAEEKKEAFLSRWSRLKTELPPEPAKEVAPPAPLPPVEKLTPESDFTGFMDPRVEDALRRVALRKLFSDPHFNLPDAYEPFSGDWTVGEPIPAAMLASLEQMKTLLSQPPAKKSGEEPTPEPKAQTDEPGKQDA